MLDEDNDEDEKDVEFDETSVNREKADAEELSGSRRVSDTFLRFSPSSSKSHQQDRFYIHLLMVNDLKPD